MSNAKEAILGRIREALTDVPEDENLQTQRNYRQEGTLGRQQVVDLFAERVAEYKAKVSRIPREEKITASIRDACHQRAVEKLVIPEGFPSDWLPEGFTFIRDSADDLVSHHELDQTDGVVTTCALGVAETGTIILDAGAGQGRRALTLIPDYHLCIVREEQIVELIPEAFDHFEQKVSQEGAPITMISGPSATSDIELNRVEGVHGPRILDVLIIGNE
ncbi:LutC/YkgG family protein [Fodinibius salsisoli]|uniref:Lactate utilization protein C n=1 Tax=Fodinibius salsisoli TaxID=2820877 RepID=A0ABT3PQ04_9BACT|nr:lactate utilization protein C [Fodinibius salsisoli]MCW9707938.1 lactate utilization protein C [Fodinibius salsisoli]